MSGTSLYQPATHIVIVKARPALLQGEPGLDAARAHITPDALSDIEHVARGFNPVYAVSHHVTAS